MTPRYLSIVVIGALFGTGIAVRAGPAYGTYAWPVEGPVIRSFEPPPDPYGAGHRGIDIGASFGTELVAAEDGIVAFAGWVGGSLFVSIDHEAGVRSTYSWLSVVDVSEGQAVQRGQAIGRTGQGHPGTPIPHLHFGTRIGDAYIDPMLMLERGSVAGLIHLAPLAPGPGPGRPPSWWPQGLWAGNLQ
jgi:murein DD-endopeptidase MepM/ murein hydrolase activator NlpD